MSLFADLPPEAQADYRLVVRQMLQFAGSYAVPIIFGEPAWKHGEVSGATGSVLRIGSRFFVLTASHVLAGYETFTSQDPESIWQVGNFGFEPIARVIARNTRADIVVLNISEQEAHAIGASVASASHGWPPPPPAVGQHVFMSGYPKILRDISAAGKIESGPLSMFLRIDSVGEDYFCCQAEREELIDCNGDSVLPEQLDFGGWSGSPILLVTQLSYPIIGIVSEYQRSYGLLRAATLAVLPSLS
jgi:hypothetical protein